MAENEFWLAIASCLIGIGMLCSLSGILTWMNEPAKVIDNEKTIIGQPIVNNYNNTILTTMTSTSTNYARTHSCIPPRNTAGFGMKDCPNAGQTTWYCNNKVVDEATSKCCQKDANGICYG